MQAKSRWFNYGRKNMEKWRIEKMEVSCNSEKRKRMVRKEYNETGEERNEMPEEWKKKLQPGIRISREMLIKKAVVHIDNNH